MEKLIALFALAGTCSAASAFAEDHGFHDRPIRHVLLISVDGMHAVDFANCARGMSTVNDGRPFCPALAALGRRGVNFVAASTAKPSDSFPGLEAIVTGASPALSGVYYDVAYDRSLDAPAKTTGNGLAAGPCTPGADPTGTRTEYEEGIDIDQSKLNGGAPGASLTDGGLNSIDPQRLIRNPRRGCAPVYPWEFVRANSIFSVVHRAGGYTAWSDKHPAYISVASGSGPAGLNDFYAPEINSNVIPLPGVATPTGVSCATVRDPNSDVSAWTNSFENIQCYDTLKVDAILNEIEGKSHLGDRRTEVPTLFGMNFQAVSVGQKLIEKSDNLKGGYLDAAGTPSAALLNEIEFVDASIGAFTAKLRDRGLAESTLVVITAKHGQAPIDPHTFVAQLKVGSSPATLLSNAGYLPYSESANNPTGIGPTEDDVSLLWLNSPSDTEAAVNLLEQNPGPTGIALGEIFYGPSLAINYNSPLEDPRSPDIIVSPDPGVIYTGSSKKQEEHGGVAHDDTNVILLVANPRFEARTVRAMVGTAQIAPTILKALDLDPRALEAVRREGTAVLPAVPFE